jgi:hypothetical protein
MVEYFRQRQKILTKGDLTMIITLNIDSENIYYKNYNIINESFIKRGANEPKIKGNLENILTSK